MSQNDVYKMCPESIETGAVSVKGEINNKWNINFLLFFYKDGCGIK